MMGATKDIRKKSDPDSIDQKFKIFIKDQRKKGLILKIAAVTILLTAVFTLIGGLGYDNSNATQPFLTNVLGNFIWSCLFMLLLLASAYLLVHALAKLMKGDIVSAAMIFFFLMLTGGMLLGFLATVLLKLIILVPSSPMIYSFSVTNHSDGSFTIEYMHSYNYSGKENNYYCNVTFPDGWQISKEGENLSGYGRVLTYPTGDNRYGLIYKTSLKNTSMPELVFFIISLPPEEADPAFINNTYAALVRELPEKTPDSSGFLDQNFSLSTNNSLGTQNIDVYGVSENKTLVRHTAYVESRNNYLVDFYYQAPYGKDQDFYYILNSIRCSSN